MQAVVVGEVEYNPWAYSWVETPYGVGHIESYDMIAKLLAIKVKWGADLKIHATKVTPLSKPPQCVLQQPQEWPQLAMPRNKRSLDIDAASRKKMQHQGSIPTMASEVPDVAMGC